MSHPNYSSLLSKLSAVVFPVDAATKRPLGPWKDKGEPISEDATLSPSAAYGINCGNSGLLVVDLDVKREDANGVLELELLELEHGPLPENAPRVKTPSGGVHIYFSCEGPTTASRIAPGIDTRGVGGYVVAPSPGAPEYRWTTQPTGRPPKPPQWLLTLLDTARTRGSLDGSNVEIDQDAAKHWARRHLASTARPAIEGRGGDNQTFEVATELRDRGLNEAEALQIMLDVYNPRCQPPWNPEDLRRKVANAYQYATRPIGTESPEADFQDESVLKLFKAHAPPPAVIPTAPQELTTSDDNQPPLHQSTYEFYEPTGMVTDDWVWVAGAKCFVRRSDCLRYDVQQFDSMYSHIVENGKISTQIFSAKKKMHRLAGLQYKPMGPEIDGEFYNLWRPNPLRPKRGDASWLEAHILYLCNENQEQADHVLDWMAWCATRPDIKLGYSLLIQGGQGVGKSLLGRLMAKVMGEGNVTEPSNETLHRTFNSWILGANLCVINELMASGRWDMANKLKPLITDPRILIEEKHKPTYEIDNYINFLLFTNHEDAIPIEVNDRRYFVVMAPAIAKSQAYYDDLWARIQSEDGAANVLAYFLDRDLTNFNPKGRAPGSPDSEDMRRAGLGDVEQYMLEAYELGDFPFNCDLVSTDDIKDSLPQDLRRGGRRLQNRIGHFLKHEVKAIKLGQHRIPEKGSSIRNSPRKVLWAIRRQSVMEALDASERAALYVKQMNEGGAPLEEDPADDFEDIED